MLRRIAAVAALVAAVSFAAPARADQIVGEGSPSDVISGTVVDFQDVEATTYTSLSTGGLDITANGDFYVADEGSVYNSTGQCLQNGPDGATYFMVVFDEPVPAFAFHIGATNDTWTLTALDESENVIDSLTIPILGSLSDGEYYGIASEGAPIAAFILEQDNPEEVDTDWILVDDITYGTAEIVDDARPLILQAGNNLDDLLPTGDKYANGAINRALKELNKALDEGNWDGDNNLTGDGAKVFRALKSAIKSLKFALKMPGLSEDEEAAIQDAIDDLVEAARVLAETSLDRFRVLGTLGIPPKFEKWIEKANEHYDAGLTDTELEKFFDAVDQFETSWEFSQRVDIAI